VLVSTAQDTSYYFQAVMEVHMTNMGWALGTNDVAC